MGRKRKTRWRRLSIGEISANEEEEDVEDGGAVIVASRNNQHSPVKQIVDKSSTMTHINSSSPLENSSANNLSSNGAASSNHHNHYHASSGGNEGSNSNRSSPHNSHNNGHHSSSSNSSGAASAEPNSSYTNSHHNHHPSSHHHSHQKGDYHHQKDYYNQPHHNSHHHHNGSGPHHNASHHYNGRGDYNHHHKEYNGKDYQNGSGEGGGGGGGDGRGGGGGRGGGHYSGYHNNYYNGSRNSYNNYRNSHYNNGEGGGGGRNSSGGGGGEHYHGNGSDYHYSPSNRSYGGGRYRKPRSYPPSNYYYSNNGSSQDPSADHTNRPSYNQDEYTKITTPRQDVLFKKGYLSQKKSSSVDSTSATTTPSASTNGTPDTQSTNGINSDYSEGYENGETDCVIPYDDTIYYGPPPEAMFTDPNTGQVYYGHCSSSGEYFDAYPVSPVMVAGYPAPVYYHLPYPTVDWNGVPTPMYPVVAAPPPMPIDDPSYSLGLQGVDTTAPITRDRDTISTTPTPATSYTSTSTTLTSGMKGEEAEADVREGQSPTTPKSKEKNKDKASGDECSSGGEERTTTEAPINTPPSKAKTSSTSSASASSNNSSTECLATSTTNTKTSSSSSSSTIASAAATAASSSTSSSPTSSKSTTVTATATAKSPESTQTYSTTMSSAPISHHQYQSKQHQHQYMAPVSYIHGNNLQNQHLHHHPRHHNHHHHHGGSGSHHPPPHHAVHHPPPPLALAAGPPPVHPPFHLYPHPAGFVYGHPVYNGVVVPIAPAASAADASNSSLEISPSSRKKRKKRRRKKDGQLTDEYSDETCSNPDDCEYDEVEEVIPDINYAYTYYYGPTPIGATQICVQGPGIHFPQDNHLELEPHHHQSTTNITHHTLHGSDDSYSSYSEPTLALSSELVKSKSQEDFAKAKDLLDQESSVPKEENCEEDQEEEEEEESVGTETEENNQDFVNQPTGAEMDTEVKTEEEASMNCSSDSNNQEEANENSDSGNGEEETAGSSAGTDESASTTNVVTEEEQAVAVVATSSVKSSSKKPVDLTVQCPPGGSLSNFAELQLLNLQRSPDGNNEPSSPDSLNTNQSVAGSEIAAGETLSVSESELMNRTTSIDEVEEDLPPEHTNEPEVYCESAYPSVQQSLSTSTTASPTFSPSRVNLLTAQDENASIQVQNENLSEEKEEEEVKEDDEQVLVANFESSLSIASPVSVSNVDVIALEESDINVLDETTKVLESEKAVLNSADVEATTATTVESCATVENITAVASVKAAEVDNETMRPGGEETVSLAKSETNEAAIESGEGDDAIRREVLSQPETTERPKSITLAVSEWLKTQGDDVLTPVIPPTSVSSEEVDDIEDEAEGDIEDSDEEDDDNNDEAQSKRIAELNQKNVHGNPWVAPSNKSGPGSLSKKNRLLNRRSESKGKREHRPVNKKTSENANFINKGVCQDGVCSRVAPKLSSSSTICNSASINSIITAKNGITNQTSDELIASAASHSNDSNYDTNTKATTINSNNSKLYDPSSISKDEDSGLELSSPESSESSENKDLNKIVSWNKSKTFEQENMSNSINKLGLTLPGCKTQDEFENVTNLENSCEKTPTSPPVSSSLPTPASSIDERNHAEICDPQKFAKYYQFGVVFDKDHDANNSSEDSLVENDNNMDTTCNCNVEDDRESMFSPFAKTDAAKTTNKSFAAVNASNLTTLKGQRQSMTVGNQHSESNEPVILKGYCDENDDEEIGTFDPRKINRRNCNFNSNATDKSPQEVDFDSDGLTTPPPFSLTPISDSSSVFTTTVANSKRKSIPTNKGNFPCTRKFSSLSTEDDDIDDEFDGFASATYDDFLEQSSVSTPSAHMYVNPMSLAAELVSSSSSTKTPLPDTWDVDSEPLPPYESPPSVDISHVFNQNTPHAKIIRSKFHTTGEPVPCAICCSVM